MIYGNRYGVAQIFSIMFNLKGVIQTLLFAFGFTLFSNISPLFIELLAISKEQLSPTSSKTTQSWQKNIERRNIFPKD